MGKKFGTGLRLEKCPFCGGSVSMYEIDDEGWRWFYIASGRNKRTCCTCGSFMESEKFFDCTSEKEKLDIRTALIEKWNRRTVEQ